MLLVIDNYDSFTYNIVQYFQQLGQTVEVVRNDKVTIDDIETMDPQYLVISPGPCSPNEAGISLEAIAYFKDKLPILGVCLGHQAIAQAFGGDVVLAHRVMHGKTSLIDHDNLGVFNKLPNPLRVTRYHSLMVKPETLPECFEVSATFGSEFGYEIMAMRHKTLPIESVQFHPESILTEQGLSLLGNFIERFSDFKPLNFFK